VTLPKSCEVEALRVWINALADCDLPESACRSCLATARAVRALLAAKVAETVSETARLTDNNGELMEEPSTIVSRVLGAP
jgi:hypothetical protein